MAVHFYTTPTSSITAWYAALTAKEKGSLQCIVRSAEVSGYNLPPLLDASK